MKIEELKNEEKDQLLTVLLTERLKSEPESKREILEIIENVSKTKIQIDIEEWAKSSNR